MWVERQECCLASLLAICLCPQYFKSKEKDETSDLNVNKNEESVFVDGKDEVNGDSKASDFDADTLRKRGRDETEEASPETSNKNNAKRAKIDECDVPVPSGPSTQQEPPVTDPITSSATATEWEKGGETASRKRPREETDEGTDQDEEDEKAAKSARLDSTLSEVTK